MSGPRFISSRDVPSASPSSRRPPRWPPFPSRRPFSWARGDDRQRLAGGYRLDTLVGGLGGRRLPHYVRPLCLAAATISAGFLLAGLHPVPGPRPLRPQPSARGAVLGVTPHPFRRRPPRRRGSTPRGRRAAAGGRRGVSPGWRLRPPAAAPPFAAYMRWRSRLCSSHALAMLNPAPSPRRKTATGGEPVPGEPAGNLRTSPMAEHSLPTRTRSSPAGRRCGPRRRPGTSPTKADTRPGRSYVLEMLPYPSGEPHIGHLKNYAVGDAIAHYHRRPGSACSTPWATTRWPSRREPRHQTGDHPRDATQASIDSYHRAVPPLGDRTNWTREFGTQSRATAAGPSGSPAAVRAGAGLPQGGRDQVVPERRRPCWPTSR